MKKYKATSEIALRIAAINHRRPDTPWMEREYTVFKRLLPIKDDDLEAVEAYYKFFWPPSREKNILRHDLLTFLNNFRGECDRAHIWREKRAAAAKKHVPRKIIPLPTAPEEQMTPKEQALFEIQFEKLTGRKPNLSRDAK